LLENILIYYQMATTYLSSASGAVPVSSENLSREHHHPHYHHPAAVAAAHGLHHGATSAASDLGGSHLSGVMNLVNSAAAISHYGGNTASSGGGSGRDSISSSSSMHEMKYIPPNHSSVTGAGTPSTDTINTTPSLHNGHHHHAAAVLSHNPWAGIPTPTEWAMHPSAINAAGLYSSSAVAHAAAQQVQDLKQDIKPHSPADFQTAMSRSAAHMAQVVHGHHPSSWNPPPVSSPYLMPGMSPGVPASAVPPGMPGAPNSPSPLQHHPAYGMNGMLPGQMPNPFVTDRYRESHNSSPRSGTDEDGMQTPTSGTYIQGTNITLYLLFIIIFSANLQRFHDIRCSGVCCSLFLTNLLSKFSKTNQHLSITYFGTIKPKKNIFQYLKSVHQHLTIFVIFSLKHSLYSKKY
jgi:hypothetical protein